LPTSFASASLAGQPEETCTWIWGCLGTILHGLPGPELLPLVPQPERITTVKQTRSFNRIGLSEKRIGQDFPASSAKV
jgi:hypothetical protein